MYLKVIYIVFSLNRQFERSFNMINLGNFYSLEFSSDEEAKFVFDDICNAIRKGAQLYEVTHTCKYVSSLYKRSEKIIRTAASVALINIKPTPQQSGMATPNNDGSLDIEFHAYPIEFPKQVEAISEELLKKLQDKEEENRDV